MGSTAAHDPTPIAREVRARWKSLEGIIKHLETPTNAFRGQTDWTRKKSSQRKV